MDLADIKGIMKDVKSIFFVGIGGISMSSIAMIMKDRGYAVSGSDRSAGAMTEKLAAHGICVHIGHDASNIEGCDALVYTAAVNNSNPEIAAAQAKGVPCFSRGDFLGWIMSVYKNRIGVCGTHGKSTTTGMISQIMLRAGTDPTVVCGAEFSEIDGAFRIGGNENFVFEACEYKDSFLSFCPSVAVVTNIDLDHPDYFKSIEQLRGSFIKYMNYADTCAVNFDSRQVRLAAAEFKGARLISFGIESGDAAVRAMNINFVKGRAEFDVYMRSAFAAHVKLKVPGTHNIYNALAAICGAYACGVDPMVSAAALSGFGGMKRRFEYKGSFGGVDVYDDYAHHPTEIRATLEAAKRLGYGHVFCIFQPHTYSRTKELFEDFSNAFSDADTVVFVDIYAAREKNEWGVSSAQLADAVRGSVYCPGFGEAADFIKAKAREHDMVITVGAGDVYKISDMLI